MSSMAKDTNTHKDYFIDTILMDKIITQLELRENEGGSNG
jgi:hypothetical protein